ncbi:MAG: hypothetical protein RL846_04650 [Deltaproteobacteria bacterium]
MTFATPKSITVIASSSPTITLAGLMSRWMIGPRCGVGVWLSSSASNTPAHSRHARRQSIGISSRSSRSVRPATISVAMYNPR